MFTIRSLLFISLSLVASSCATLKVNRPEVTRVKRVAIVGYLGQLRLEQEQKGLAAIVGAAKSNADLFSGKLSERRTAQASADYDALSKLLSDELKWEVVDKSVVTQSAAYAALSRTSGGIFMVQHQYVPGIAPPIQVSEQAQQLRNLAKALDVDAVALVDLQYEATKVRGISVMGLGNRTVYPSATARFKVFNANGEFIWEDLSAKGPVTKEGLRNTVGADIVSNETKVLHDASMGAFRAVIAHFRARSS